MNPHDQGLTHLHWQFGHRPAGRRGLLPGSLDRYSSRWSAATDIAWQAYGSSRTSTGSSASHNDSTCQPTERSIRSPTQPTGILSPTRTQRVRTATISSEVIRPRGRRGTASLDQPPYSGSERPVVAKLVIARINEANRSVISMSFTKATPASHIASDLHLHRSTRHRQRPPHNLSRRHLKYSPSPVSKESAGRQGSQTRDSSRRSGVGQRSSVSGLTISPLVHVLYDTASKWHATQALPRHRPDRYDPSVTTGATKECDRSGA